MHGPSLQTLQHEHVFLGDDHERNERRTWFVIALTATMMVIEIVAGTIYGSMALVADGWHMSTHAAAMLISALAYLYARRHARDPRFTFGTGKLGDLAGFASAIILALIALLIGWESLLRWPVPSPSTSVRPSQSQSSALSSTWPVRGCSRMTTITVGTITITAPSYHGIMITGISTTMARTTGITITTTHMSPAATTTFGPPICMSSRMP